MEYFVVCRSDGGTTEMWSFNVIHGAKRSQGAGEGLCAPFLLPSRRPGECQTLGFFCLILGRVGVLPARLRPLERCEAITWSCRRFYPAECFNTPPNSPNPKWRLVPSIRGVLVEGSGKKDVCACRRSFLCRDGRRLMFLTSSSSTGCVQKSRLVTQLRRGGEISACTGC